MGSRGFNLIEWSVRHPSAVLAFYTAVTVLAIWAIVAYLPRRMMPYIESPQIGIVTRAPGLSAEDMETYYTKPIEQRMTGIAGVRYIRSTTQDGYSIVVLEFPYGTPMQKKLTEVQALMTAVQDDLPMQGANTQPSWVLQIDPLNLPVLTIAVTGDHRWTTTRMRQVLENEIADRLKRTSGDIYTVSVFGGYRRQLQVIVDRNKLAAYNLSIRDVQRAVDAFNLAAPAGRLTAGEHEEIVRMDTLARDAEEVANYPLKAEGDRVVRIRDVARVVDTYDEKRSGYFHQWQRSPADGGQDREWQIDEAIAVNILQNPWASSPRVIEAVMKELKAVERDYPGLQFRVAYNNAEFVDVLLRNLWEELLLAVLLAGLVVFIFLWLMKQAFSTVSLLGIIVLTGMDITAAILMIDLILVLRAQGMPRDEAVVLGCVDRLRPILMTVMVTIAALAPVAFFPKMGTDAYQPLATAVIGGLLMGTVLTLMDIPILHSLVDDLLRWLRRGRAVEREG